MPKAKEKKTVMAYRCLNKTCNAASTDLSKFPPKGWTAAKFYNVTASGHTMVVAEGAFCPKCMKKHDEMRPSPGPFEVTVK